MKYTHQADLSWRFLCADDDRSLVPSSFLIMKRWHERGGPGPRKEVGSSTTDAELYMRDRVARIDAILDRLPLRPVHQRRVLAMRYGFEEDLPAMSEVLPNMSGVAVLTERARTWFERVHKKPPRPRSFDLRAFLEVICIRVSVREATVTDEIVLAQVRTEAVRLLLDAEEAYEQLAARYDRRTRTWAA